jgi:phosphatidylglycerophosphate synthase
MRHFFFRNLPNILSAARIVAAPLLVLLAIWRQETIFTGLLIVALVTDIADGLIARAFDLSSKLGAMLDSIADVLILFAACYGAWIFHQDICIAHSTAISVFVGAWLAETGAALWRYGKLSSFHTYAAKVSGYLLGIFIGVLFVFGFVPWLFYAAVTVSVLSNLEEMVLLWRLPEWRPNVRGLWWVLRERRNDA